MSTEENKAVALRWIEARNAFDLNAALPLWVDERHDSITTAFGNFSTAFPDLNVAVKEMIAEGDKVAVLLTMRGTHLGTWAGVPATGRKVEWTFVDIYTFRSGKLAGNVRTGQSLKGLLLSSQPAATPGKLIEEEKGGRR